MAEVTAGWLTTKAIAAVVRVVVHRHGHLRCQHDVVAAALERLVDDLLRLAGRVDAVSTKLIPASSAADDADRVVVVGVAPGAEIIMPRQSLETWTPVRPSGR